MGIIKNKKILFSFIFWLSFIGLFDLILLLKKENEFLTNIEVLFLTITVITGIISFLVFILTLEKIFHQKYSGIKASIFASLSFILLLIIGIGLIIGPLILFNKNTPQIVKTSEASKNTLIAAGLRLGSTGDQVKILQSALSTDKSIYPSGVVSGYYGELTKQAVINFQEKYNLSTTGKIDQQTAEKFNEVYGKKTREFYLDKVAEIKTNNDSTNSNMINISDQNGENYKMRPDPSAPPGFFKMENIPPEKMTTVDELNQAMNTYRRSHGLNELNINRELCLYADQRAHEIASVFTHDAFVNHVKNGDYRNSGYSWFNENIWQGYFSGTHIVEYAWDRSEGHRHTQLNNWSGGCAGVYDKYVSFIFAR